MRFKHVLVMLPGLLVAAAALADPPQIRENKIRDLPAGSTKIALPQRDGGGQVIWLAEPRDYYGGIGEFTFPLTGNEEFGEPITGMAFNTRVIGTERGLTRYTFWICDNMDAAFSMPASYVLHTGLHHQSFDVCASAFGCATNQPIPGTECDIQVDSCNITDPDGDITTVCCQELECKVA